MPQITIIRYSIFSTRFHNAQLCIVNINMTGLDTSILLKNCSELGTGATSETGKYLFRADNVCWRCAQYLVIASCGYLVARCLDA